jgi:hypothetical protein
MNGKEEGITQPRYDILAAPRSVTISSLVLPMEYRAPQHALHSLQRQAQMPANVTAAGNGLPFQQYPAYHTHWQAKQNYLHGSQTGHGPQLAFPSGISRPPSATASTVPSTATARQPPQSGNYVGNNNANLNVSASQPQSGVSVPKPSNVAEFLSFTGNNGMRNGHTACIPKMPTNPINFHRQDQQILQRQQQLVREYQQQQLQQQRKQPLPPRPPEQQQLLGQQHVQRPPPVPHAPSLPSRPLPPSPFLNIFSPARHPQLNNNNNLNVAPRPPLPQPTQTPVFIALPSAPSPPPPVLNSLPDAHPTSAVDLAAVPDLPFPQLDEAGLYPSFEDIELPFNVPLELTDARFYEEYPRRSHIVAATQNVSPLQAEQAQHMQQQVMESVRNLPIPMEIQQEIHAGTGIGAGMAVPTTAGGGAAVPIAAVEAPSAAVVQVSEEEVHVGLAAKEADELKIQGEKRKLRRERQTENKRRQRQRYKDEEEAKRNAIIRALEAAENELANLKLNNARLILSTFESAKVMHVRNAMLKVFYLEGKGEEEKSAFAREEQVKERLLGSSAVLTPEIVAVKEIKRVGDPSSTVTATAAVAAEEKEKAKEEQQQRPSSPSSPSPVVPPPQQPDQQQLYTFEIAESLAHTEIDACLSYTRQFLIDVKLSVEEAFDDNFPPELVALIENRVKKGRSVYKRVLEERKDVYYAHVCRLSENAIVGAAKTKEAAALLLNRGISTAQLLKLEETLRRFHSDDRFARTKLVESQKTVNRLLETLGSTINTAAGGVCHALQAGHNVEVTTCVQKWEHFSSMRQNFMVRLEEKFFQVGV